MSSPPQKGSAQPLYIVIKHDIMLSHISEEDLVSSSFVLVYVLAICKLALHLL